MEYFKAEVMEMCHRENLYQIDLLNGARTVLPSVSIGRSGKDKPHLDKGNASLAAAGEPPKVTKFETDKGAVTQRDPAPPCPLPFPLRDFSGKLLQQRRDRQESRGD